MYEGLLFAHILAAVVWVGGAVTLQVLSLRAQRSGDPGRMATIALDAEWLGTGIFVPASIVLLLTGVGLVLEGSWGFDHFWIIFGLAVFAFSFVTGSFFLGPELGRLANLISGEGVEEAALRSRIGRVFLVSRIELALLVGVVFDMAAKPGL